MRSLRSTQACSFIEILQMETRKKTVNNEEIKQKIQNSFHEL